MARKPVEIPIASDTRQFSKAIDKGVIDPLEDAEKALDDVAKEGDRASDRLVDGMKDAQRATEQMHDAMKDGSSARSFSQNTAQATSKTKASMREVGAEARANASETFSSFDGSAQSFMDGIQGTFGGLIAAFGPIGIAAAAAGAAGVGLLSSAIEKSRERAQKLKEKISDLTGSMIDAGGKGVIAFDDITDALGDMASQTEQGEKSLKDISRQALDTSQDFATLAQAFAGNPAALEEAIRQTERMVELEQQRYDATKKRGSREQDNERLTEGKKLLQQLEDTNTAYKEAATNEALWAAAGGPEIATKTSLVKSLNDSYDEGATSVDDYIDKESGLFDVSKYIKAMDKRAAALKGYQNNLIQAELPADVVGFLNEQGADTAATMVQGYIDASPKQQAKLLAIWKTAATDISGVVDKKVTAIVDKSYEGPTIKPKLDTTQYNLAVNKIKRGINVPVYLTTRDGKPVV